MPVERNKKVINNTSAMIGGKKLERECAARHDSSLVPVYGSHIRIGI
jgi:hypothetical protein